MHLGISKTRLGASKTRLGVAKMRLATRLRRLTFAQMPLDYEINKNGEPQLAVCLPEGTAAIP